MEIKLKINYRHSYGFILPFLDDFLNCNESSFFDTNAHHITLEIHQKLVFHLQEQLRLNGFQKNSLSTYYIKNKFKGIYGKPIGNYIKEYHVRQAASPDTKNKMSVNRNIMKNGTVK